MNGTTDPKILAEFILDQDGNPKVMLARFKQHYKIRLTVKNAPPDAYSVVYELDPTYVDYIREANDPSNKFSEDLTSYGDYTIKATIRTKTGLRLIKRDLGEALESNYSPSTISPAIKEAVDYIKGH